MLDSFAPLCAEADLVLVEGAGSASEVNLRTGDIANMGFARAADVPVVLIGDIDRGGVIASLVGTKAVLPPDDARMIEGFIVNKFRGDPTLFADGMARVREMTGWRASASCRTSTAPVACRPRTRSASTPRRSPSRTPRCAIVVLAYPRISNFDDFDPLRLEPAVDLTFLRPGEPIPANVDLVILPGSKATIADLAALRAARWDVDLDAHVRRGGRVLGICGGYQMLGKRVADPHGIEGPPSTVRRPRAARCRDRADGRQAAAGGRRAPARTVARRSAGYEMHVGRTTGRDCARAVVTFADGRDDGAASADGRVSGCYVHGLFADDRQRSAWLARLGAGQSAVRYEEVVDATLDALAAHLERHLDCDALLATARTPRFK